MEIQTVLGPIAPETLGVTIPHEHIQLDLRHHAFAVEATLDDPAMAVEELQRFRDAGGGAVVDLTNRYLGRRVDVQVQVARETGLNIIAATGYYTELYYPPHVYQWSTNRLADEMITELTVGMDGGDIRAGIIGEIGTVRDFITPAGERVFRAAARASIHTGAAISTHIFLEDLPHEQLDLLAEEGVKMSRIIVGHLGDKRNFDLLRSIADRGPFIEIDHIGMDFYQRDDVRAATVAQLVREGYAGQLLLSQDVCFKRLLHWFGGRGYDGILTSFVPLLEANGVTKADIDRMLIENPRRALAF